MMTPGFFPTTVHGLNILKDKGIIIRLSLVKKRFFFILAMHTIALATLQSGIYKDRVIWLTLPFKERMLL
jgi:hypothetical protein